MLTAINGLHRPFFADRCGRKVPIMIGCVIEFIGTFIGAFSNSTGSMSPQGSEQVFMQERVLIIDVSQCTWPVVSSSASVAHSWEWRTS